MSTFTGTTTASGGTGSGITLVPRVFPRCTRKGQTNCLLHEVVIEGDSGTGGTGIPDSPYVIEFHLLLIDPRGGSRLVRRRFADPLSIYGAGTPDGFRGPPSFNPTGPFSGLVYPFRDTLNPPRSRITATTVPGGFDDHPNNGTFARHGAAISDIRAEIDIRRWPGTSPTWRGNPGSGFGGSPRDGIRVYRTEIVVNDPTPRAIELHFVPVMVGGVASAKVRMSNGSVVTPRVAPSMIAISVK